MLVETGYVGVINRCIPLCHARRLVYFCNGGRAHCVARALAIDRVKFFAIRHPRRFPFPVSSHPEIVNSVLI